MKSSKITRNISEKILQIENYTLNIDAIPAESQKNCDLDTSYLTYLYSVIFLSTKDLDTSYQSTSKKIQQYPRANH